MYISQQFCLLLSLIGPFSLNSRDEDMGNFEKTTKNKEEEEEEDK
jgi:hypothetical protein